MSVATSLLVLLLCSNKASTTVSAFGARHSTLGLAASSRCAPTWNYQWNERRLPSPATRVSMATDKGGSNDFNSDDLVTKRRKRVDIGYAASAISWGVVSAVIFSRAVRSTANGSATAASLGVAGSLLSRRLFAMVLSYIERGAAVHDRLGSDTYRRMNVALLGHSVLGLAASAVLHSSSASVTRLVALVAAASFLTAVPAFKGWWYGVRGWDTAKKGGAAAMTSDLVKIAKDSLAGCFKCSNFKALLYLAVTWFAMSFKLTELYKIGQFAFGNGERIGTAVASSIIRFSDFSLLSCVSYTLKDAADRGRLEGTTFIELNLASAVVFIALAANLATAGIGIRLVSAAVGASAFTAGNGFVSIWKKNKK
eukprot:CAMPEP_0113582136 /NCGR_PEP_ID=MMETSP0015_2-20120614/31725_1 /TAXON_ID=2838 /ORGANISM="Odontella" /LENGTH=367 /DNA_ID=CAMNT_0000486731 /DNA_START=16 /DNA_END=1119 /DNA_ORIENTATION=- /assembly_acc=CAM_ASM_000160